LIGHLKLNKPATDYTRSLNAITYARDMGVLQLKVESDSYDGRIVTVAGKDLVHFGNCSYVGLDTCEALKQGGIDAITRYGNFFSSSRLCIGLDLNEKLEALLDQITGYHTLVTQTTSLASLSAVPIITSPNDLIVLDHQVHASVQNAVKIAQTQGTKVAMIRHSNMSALEDLIKKQKRNYEKIWYMADGMYSMLGDPCPIEQMYELMDRHQNFHCYVDDAHGISWIGKHGKGWTLHKRPLHPQMVLAMSMAKGFGSCGGILVFPTPEARHMIRCLGSSLIYSGPIPTAVLGACIASAKLHLTDEITFRQNNLYARMKHFRELAYAFGLPLVNHSFSPIFYFGCGGLENAGYISKKMLDAGFYVNICGYPTVPQKYSGIRMSITTHLTFKDIENAASTLACLVDELENEGKLNREKVYKDFRAMEVVKESTVNNSVMA
jgi:7-keto-8-aminopelargonate synthetase-like enzyme